MCCCVEVVLIVVVAAVVVLAFLSQVLFVLVVCCARSDLLRRFYPNEKRFPKVLNVFREKAGRDVYMQCEVFPWPPAYDR